MPPRILVLIPALCLPLVACDQAKKLAGQMKSAVEKQISASKKGSETAGSQPSEGLQKQVDQAPEGVMFRKDMPFPTKLDVRTTVREEIVGRTFQASAIDKHSEDVKGTKTVITLLERDGDQVRYTLEQSSFAAPVTDGADGAKDAIANPIANAAPAAKPMTYIRTGKTWKCSTRDGFRAVALSKQLAPVFDQLLVENGLAGRKLWFGPRRFKSGDRITIGGNTLPMLLAGDSTGSFMLTFDKTDAVEGHPCGVFNVTGYFTRKQIPDFEGTVTDQEVTIDSGRIWLSLLYPVILKEEFDTIQTTRSGGRGGQSERGQGKVKVTVTRDWKAK